MSIDDYNFSVAHEGMRGEPLSKHERVYQAFLAIAERVYKEYIQDKLKEHAYYPYHYLEDIASKISVGIIINIDDIAKKDDVYSDLIEDIINECSQNKEKLDSDDEDTNKPLPYTDDESTKKHLQFALKNWQKIKSVGFFPNYNVGNVLPNYDMFENMCIAQYASMSDFGGGYVSMYNDVKRKWHDKIFRGVERKLIGNNCVALINLFPYGMLGEERRKQYSDALQRVRQASRNYMCDAKEYNERKKEHKDKQVNIRINLGDLKLKDPSERPELKDKIAKAKSDCKKLQQWLKPKNKELNKLKKTFEKEEKKLHEIARSHVLSLHESLCKKGGDKIDEDNLVKRGWTVVIEMMVSKKWKRARKNGLMQKMVCLLANQSGVYTNDNFAFEDDSRLLLALLITEIAMRTRKLNNKAIDRILPLVQKVYNKKVSYEHPGTDREIFSAAHRKLDSFRNTAASRLRTKKVIYKSVSKAQQCIESGEAYFKAKLNEEKICHLNALEYHLKKKVSFNKEESKKSKKLFPNGLKNFITMQRCKIRISETKELYERLKNILFQIRQEVDGVMNSATYVSKYKKSHGLRDISKILNSEELIGVFYPEQNSKDIQPHKIDTLISAFVKIQEVADRKEHDWTHYFRKTGAFSYIRPKPLSEFYHVLNNCDLGEANDFGKILEKLKELKADAIKRSDVNANRPHTAPTTRKEYNKLGESFPSDNDCMSTEDMRKSL